jgi:hypothetical protein
VGLLNWLFGRGKGRAVAELPQAVAPSVPPRQEAAAEPVLEPPGEAESEPEVRAESAPEQAGEISPSRLDAALERLREEIPASSEETPPGPSA